jgi:hypothetical protein
VDERTEGDALLREDLGRVHGALLEAEVDFSPIVNADATRFDLSWLDAYLRAPASAAPESSEPLAKVEKGQRVRHARFGDGVVMRVEPGAQTMVTVQFYDAGEKRMALALAKLIAIS